MFVKIIDNDNKEIGCIERGRLVPLGLRHQIGRVIIYAKDTQAILLQQRSLNKSTMPGAWDTSSSGHIDAHEEVVDGTAREMREEIGIEPYGLERVGEYDTYEELSDGVLNRQTVVYAMMVNKPEDIAPTVDPVELEQIAWIPLNNLASIKEDVTRGAQQAIDIFCEWLSKKPLS